MTCWRGRGCPREESGSAAGGDQARHRRAWRYAVVLIRLPAVGVEPSDVDGDAPSCDRRLVDDEPPVVFEVDSVLA